jgi:cytochrome b subunit of formate dehydrogenase
MVAVWYLSNEPLYMAPASRMRWILTRAGMHSAAALHCVCLALVHILMLGLLTCPLPPAGLAVWCGQ